jgi:cation diffusion facilitator CzcD-associated flavoprotein CzcO
MRLAIQEDLPALADRIINPQPSVMAKIAGIFNKNAIAKALSEAWEETRRVAMGKTKTLVDVVQKMDGELRQEQVKLEGEIRSLEQLKESYRDRYSDFVVTVAFLSNFLAQSKTDVAKREVGSNLNDPQQAAAIVELKDKLQALESRALALEGTLSRLPADQLVIRQLQNAAITTLQETTTTASARFSSIKMTLLTIHSALVTKSVQQLAQQGANLDENLASVRATLMKDVVAKAATAPGDNRLAQAQQLKSIVAETSNLVMLVEQARETNQVKFAQARELFAQARKDMLEIGLKVQPQNSIKY